jgi:antitoxin (DNA-binding transcriptional repressor) of toxin-antitoxin stability system
MKTVTVTELAENLSQILDDLEVRREEVVIERDHRQIARIVPGPKQMTALEAMSGLYGILPESAAPTWESDSRAIGLKGQRLPNGVRDPWES